MATSYDNICGKGDRRSLISVSSSLNLWFSSDYDSVESLVNGSLIDNDLVFKNGDGTGHFIEFDFGEGSKKIIDQITYYQQDSTSHGTWKFQGSDDLIEYTDVGSSFTLGGSDVQVISFDNVGGYRYYRLLCVSGNVSWNPFLYEIEFRIDDYQEELEEHKYIPGIQPPTFEFLMRDKKKDRFIHLAKRGS